MTTPVVGRQRVIPATRWAAVAQAARQIGQIASALVLARLVSPADFGLMTMALVVAGFVAVMRDFGVGAAVVQAENLTEELSSTQFWMALLFGLFAAVVLVAVAPVAAAFYREPDVTDVLRVMSLTFVIASAAVVHQARLERALRFRAVATAEVAAFVIGLVVAVAVAVAGGGVWSFVAQSLAAAVVATIVLWVAGGWRPTLTITRASARFGWRYGAPLTAFNAINYVARNADYAVIGRVLGATSLGYYTVAYRLMLFPLQAIVGVVNRVMFPALASLRTEPERLRASYVRSLGGAVFLAFPIAIGIGATADRLVPLLLGPGWEPAVDVVRILSVVACLQSIGATVGPIYLATGRTGLLLAWGGVVATIVIASFVVGVNAGILGVASAYAVAQALTAYPSLAIPFRLIDLRVRDVLPTIARPLALAILAGGLAILLGRVSPASWPNLVVLSLQIVAVVSTYVAGSWWLNREQATLALDVAGLRVRGGA
jgi:PST family polysaccharide transporter